MSLWHLLLHHDSGIVSFQIMITTHLWSIVNMSKYRLSFHHEEHEEGLYKNKTSCSSWLIFYPFNAQLQNRLKLSGNHFSN